MLENNRSPLDFKTFRWNGLLPIVFGICLTVIGAYGMIHPGNWKTGPEIARRVYSGCLLLGLVLLFSQRGSRLDLQAREVTTWWGLRFPLVKWVRSLDDFEWVTLSDETHVHGHGGSLSFPVRLHGSGRDVQIADSWSFDTSWLLAKEAAEFLSLKLWDATSERQFEGSALESPLYQRVDRELVLSLEAPPPAAKSQVRGNEYGLTAVVPASGFRWRHLAMGAVLPPILGLAFRYQHQVDQLSHFAHDPWFWGLTAFFGIVFIGAGILGSTLSEQLTVSKSGVQLVRRSWFGSKVLSIPVHEVMQIEVVWRSISSHALPRLTTSKHSIEIRGIRRVIGLGSGLARDELEWLVQCLKVAVARYTA